MKLKKLRLQIPKNSSLAKVEYMDPYVNDFDNKETWMTPNDILPPTYTYETLQEAIDNGLKIDTFKIQNHVSENKKDLDIAKGGIAPDNLILTQYDAEGHVALAWISAQARLYRNCNVLYNKFYSCSLETITNTLNPAYSHDSDIVSINYSSGRVKIEYDTAIGASYEGRIIYNEPPLEVNKDYILSYGTGFGNGYNIFDNSNSARFVPHPEEEYIGISDSFDSNTVIQRYVTNTPDAYLFLKTKIIISIIVEYEDATEEIFESKPMNGDLTTVLNDVWFTKIKLTKNYTGLRIKVVVLNDELEAHSEGSATIGDSYDMSYEATYLCVHDYIPSDVFVKKESNTNFIDNNIQILLGTDVDTIVTVMNLSENTKKELYVDNEKIDYIIPFDNFRNMDGTVADKNSDGTVVFPKIKLNDNDDHWTVVDSNADINTEYTSISSRISLKNVNGLPDGDILKEQNLKDSFIGFIPVTVDKSWSDIHKIFSKDISFEINKNGNISTTKILLDSSTDSDILMYLQIPLSEASKLDLETIENFTYTDYTSDVKLRIPATDIVDANGRCTHVIIPIEYTASEYEHIFQRFIHIVASKDTNLNGIILFSLKASAIIYKLSSIESIPYKMGANSLNASRFAATSFYLESTNKVYVVGGRSVFNTATPVYLDDIEIDLSTGLNAPATYQLPVRAANLASFVLNGNAYVLTDDKLYLFDPNSGYVSKNNFPIVTKNPIPFVLDNEIYVLCTGSTPSLYVYNESTDSWIPKNNPRFGPEEPILNIGSGSYFEDSENKIHIVYEDNSNNVTWHSHIMYDKTEDVWIGKAHLVTNHDDKGVVPHVMSCVYEGRHTGAVCNLAIYSAGYGLWGESDVWIYDDINDAWIQKENVYSGSSVGGFMCKVSKYRYISGGGYAGYPDGTRADYNSNKRIFDFITNIGFIKTFVAEYDGFVDTSYDDRTIDLYDINSNSAQNKTKLDIKYMYDLTYDETKEIYMEYDLNTGTEDLAVYEDISVLQITIDKNIYAYTYGIPKIDLNIAVTDDNQDWLTVIDGAHNTIKPVVFENSTNHIDYAAISLNNKKEKDPDIVTTNISCRYLKISVPDNNMYSRDKSTGIATPLNQKGLYLRGLNVFTTTDIPYSITTLGNATLDGILLLKTELEEILRKPVKDTRHDIKITSDIIIDLGSIVNVSKIYLVIGKYAESTKYEGTYSFSVSTDGITYNYTQAFDPMSVSAESYLESLVVKKFIYGLGHIGLYQLMLTIRDNETTLCKLKGE